MKDFAGVVQMQVDTLLETLRRHQSMRCQQISSAAEKRAADLLKAARRQSRERMRQAVVQERQRIDAALSQAHGRIRTRQRRLLQQHYQDLLKEGWGLLEASLQARWQDSRQRRAWCEALLEDAREVFGSAPLVIEHPPAWQEEDKAWLAALAGDSSGSEVSFRPDEGISCGLRVSTPHACLDATPDGLLGDRREAQGVLLAAWEKAVAGRPEEKPAKAGLDADHD